MNRSIRFNLMVGAALAGAVGSGMLARGDDGLTTLGAGFHQVALDQDATGPETNVNVTVESSADGDFANDGQTGNGALDDSLQVPPPQQVGTVSDAGFAHWAEAAAAQSSGQLRGLSLAVAGPEANGETDANSKSTLQDTVTLSTAAPITISGTLDGYLESTPGNAQVFLGVYFVDPAQTAGGFTFILGGVEYNNQNLSSTLGVGDTTTVESADNQIIVPFSVTVNLPAGTTVLSAELDTHAFSSAGFGGSTGYAYADFSHTIDFSLSAPDGVTVTTGGLVAVVPEPATVGILLLGTMMVGLRRRR